MKKLYFIYAAIAAFLFSLMFIERDAPHTDVLHVEQNVRAKLHADTFFANFFEKHEEFYVLMLDTSSKDKLSEADTLRVFFKEEERKKILKSIFLKAKHPESDIYVVTDKMRQNIPLARSMQEVLNLYFYEDGTVEGKFEDYDPLDVSAGL